MPNRSQRHLREIQGLDSSGRDATGSVPAPPTLPLGTPAPLDGAFHGGGTTNASLAITGGPLPADIQATVSNLSMDGLTFDPVVVDLAAGDTAEIAAGKIAAALEGLQDTTSAEELHATATGGQVVVQGTGPGGNVFDADPTIAWA